MCHKKSPIISTLFTNVNISCLHGQQSSRWPRVCNRKDTKFCGSWDPAYTFFNMSMIWSSLFVYLNTSKIFCFGQAKDVENQYRVLFGCEIGYFPFKYLGISIHFRKLRNVEWKRIEEIFEKKSLVRLGSFDLMEIS
jgi:hypothetical protein